MKKLVKDRRVQSFFLGACLLAVSASESVVAQGTLRSEIVAQQYATSEAPGSIGPFLSDGARYMMVYQRGLFSPAMQDGALITQIAFRVDGPNGGQFGGGNIVSAALPHIEIHMSTSQAPPISSQPPVDQFGSRNFAPNVGADDTVVFQRGSLNWQSSWSSTGPNPFVLTIPLSNRFSTTTIQLVRTAIGPNLTQPYATGEVFTNPGVPVADVEISDLTIDCNGWRQPRTGDINDPKLDPANIKKRGSTHNNFPLVERKTVARL